MENKDYLNENIQLLNSLSRLLTANNGETRAVPLDSDYERDSDSLESLIKKWDEEIRSVGEKAEKASRWAWLQVLKNYFLNNKSRRLLGGKDFVNLGKAFDEGGLAAVDALLSKCGGSLASDAAASLARQLAQKDPEASSELAYRAWKNDPKAYRLKWYAFRLNAADNSKNALAILNLIKDKTNFSDSEVRVHMALQDKYKDGDKDQNEPQAQFFYSLGTVDTVMDIGEREDADLPFIMLTAKFSCEIKDKSARLIYEMQENGATSFDDSWGCIFLSSAGLPRLTRKILLRNPGKGLARIHLAFTPVNDEETLSISETRIDFLAELPRTDYPSSIDDVCEIYEADERSLYNARTELFCENNPDSGFAINFYDSHFNMALPSSSFSVNPDFGNYIYLARRGKESPEFQLPTDKNISFIKLEGKKWSRGGLMLLKSRPELLFEKNLYEEINRLKELAANIAPEDKVMIVYASTASIGYEKPIKLRSARLAQYFSEHGWKVLYCTFNAPSRLILSENLFQAGPQHKFEIINILARRKGKNNCLFITSFADVNAVGVLNRARNMGWRTVFELRDDMEEMWSLGISRWYNPAIEQYIASHVDKLAAVSWRLQNRLEAMTGGKDVILSPNGVSQKFSEDCAPLRTAAASRNRQQFKIIGYVGSLNPNFFDWALLKNYARRNPDVQIEIIGNGWPQNYSLPDNIIYLGEIYHDDSLEIVSRWSAGLIPFLISRLAWGVSPNKAYEYLAMGLRIISSPMGRVHELPLVKVYTGLESFEKAVAQSFKPVTEKEYAQVEKFLQTDSWQRRFDKLAQDLLK